jgi:type IV pilus assembly protein PilA
MIVVAIIGLLAAIAIPQYQQYAVRAKVVEGLSIADAAKIAVWDAVSSNQGVQIAGYVCCAAAGTIGFALTSPTSLVSRVDISPIAAVPGLDTDGIITVTFTTAVATPFQLVMNLVPGSGTIAAGNLPSGAITPGQPLVWGCNVGGVFQNYPFVPANCRA